MVVFFMIDGLRPDAISAARCPAVAALLARGAATRQATSVMPSITLPCHMSIFHSVPPTRHGVTTNEWSPMARPLPGLFEVAHAAGRRCAVFYNWEPLRNVSRPGSLAYAYFRDNVLTPLGDQVTAETAVQVMAAERFDFAWVYFGTVDEAGHAHGWLSDGYFEQLARADQALQLVLQSLPADSHVLLHSDHGGHERTHGTPAAEDMTIPWVVAGPRIRPGFTLPAPVSLLDTAPTLARLLDIAPHPQWEGRCVEEAFK
ncbi:MAG: alkaline phosphatase family protein [Anaerolineales bacterium]|nr:alkaline phosphatase family protein [Anaerolineales bacterium]